ncbi:hypothetical protein Q3G72_002409 [Acer saccharum]|nr:hypothetical protein Q3G72_002409 [Acer saccharum]
MRRPSTLVLENNWMVKLQECFTRVITDNAPVCKAVGLLIESRFQHIFCTPSVVHTLNIANIPSFINMKNMTIEMSLLIEEIRRLLQCIPESVIIRIVENRQHFWVFNMEIGTFFHQNEIAFNIANSPSFINICQAIESYGHGLKLPTSYELRTSILKVQEANTQAVVDEVKKK